MIDDRDDDEGHEEAQKHIAGDLLVQNLVALGSADGGAAYRGGVGHGQSFRCREVEVLAQRRR